MTFKKMLKISLTLLVILYCGFAFTQNTESFNSQMKAYSDTQKVIEYFVRNEFVINEAGYWHPNVDKLYNSARNNKINEDRVEAMAKISNTIAMQNLNGFAQFDRFIEDIFKAATFNDQQIIFSIAVTKLMKTFLQKNRRFNNKTISEDLKDIKKEAQNYISIYVNGDSGGFTPSLLEKVKNRFKDDELRGLTEDYLRLFPDAQKDLIFHSGQAKVNNFDECCEVLDECMIAFWKLDETSALSNFREWGKYMLNYLLLDYHPVMVKEFKKQMENYKQSFKTQ